MESPSSSSPSSEPPAEAAAAATTPRDDAQTSPDAQTTSPAAAAPDGDARWARPAQRHFLEATCDAPPLRFGRGSAGGSSSRALFGVRAQEQAVFERLRRSAAQGESTSLVLCGHRGCGKHATLARALARLDADATLPRYDVAELSGLVHAEAATGLRELVNQLAAESGRAAAATSRYVDDLALVVDELRRRRAERRAPLLVVLSELDAFALQPRQTLLYTLLDAMQSRLGCVVVVGVTTDHGVLELFEKRVRSRLQNHHVSFTQALACDVVACWDDRMALDGAALRAAAVAPRRRKRPRDPAPPAPDAASDDDGSADAYAQRHSANWAAIRTSPQFQNRVRDGVAAGRSLRWFSRVMARACASLAPDAPLLSAATVEEAFRSMDPNAGAAWRAAVSAMPPAEKALLVAFLKLERVGAPYTLESAIHVLGRLSQASAADAYEEEGLVDAMAALVDKDVAVLAQERGAPRRDTHALRFAHVRLAAAVDVDDLWLALRTDDLGCPTTLRQWALNHI